MRGLILSAGLGERLRPLTLKKAKPAIEFLNIPMLGFPYYWLNTVGLSQLVFNTHYLPETVRHAAMHVIDPRLPLHFSHESTILGSGGGIWNARPLLEGDRNFIVANGDGVVLFEHPDTLEQMLLFHEKHDALATLLVCPLEGVGTRIPGVWINNTGEIINFGKSSERTDAQCLHYASYMILSKRIWNYLPEGGSNILYDVIQPQIPLGEKAYGFRVDNMRWYETGNASEYLSATKDCLHLMRGPTGLGKCARDIVKQLAPGSELSEMHLISDKATIAASAKISGFAVIGEDVEIASSSIIEDSVILPGRKIEAGASIKNLIC